MLRAAITSGNRSMLRAAITSARSFGRGLYPGCSMVEVEKGTHVFSTHPFPYTAAGFRLHEVPRAAACTSRGHQWLPESTVPATFRCTGTPERFEIPVEATLTICEDGLVCMVVLTHNCTTENPQQCIDQFERVEDRLWLRFGAPEQRDHEAPRGCLGSSVFDDCLLNGRIKFRSVWRWRSGHRVTLGLLRTRGKNGAHRGIFVTYTTKAGSALSSG